MAHGFDEAYWESHWQQAGRHGVGRSNGPNPWLVREVAELAPGTALDAGCGEGAEAVHLAAAGWQVTAVDVSATVLARATGRADRGPEPAHRIEWVQADLGTWDPGRRFDLVVTHYAHPAMPQLAFYRRLAGWVAPGGTLLVVGHRHDPDAIGHGHQPPEEATVTAAATTALLDASGWEVVTAEERTRTLAGRPGHGEELHDVIVRATRRDG